MLTQSVADGDLFESASLTQQVEGEHLRIVVVVDDLGHRRGLSRESPHPRLPVRYAAPREEYEQEGERVVPDTAVEFHPSHPFEEPATQHVIRSSSKNWLHEAWYVLRVILEVRVEISDGISAALDGGA